jgi:purine-nucleoside phosphorylase
MPRVDLILGTGLGGIADLMENPVYVPFAALPDFPVSSVASHASRFVAGTVSGVPVIVQQGRCHIYEGYSPADVCMGTRVMAALGIFTLIVTNAAGAVNPQYNAGDVMLITDHINFMSQSPLTEANHDEAGPRFPDMSIAYDKELRALAMKTALEGGCKKF